MKKLLSILAAVFITATIWAQSPQKMSYQAVLRDTGNNLIKSQKVGMRISILKNSASGTAVYTETQTPTTNANGLVSIEIGGGAGFDAINWGSSTYFIKTETDPAGGTNYTINSTIQSLSVPYAWYAKTVHVTYRISATGDTLDLRNGKYIFIPSISTANPNTSTYMLNVTATNGTGVKDPDQAAYANGSTVQLNAMPNSGYKFISWSGGASGSTNPLPVFMNANKTITANFAPVAANTFTLQVTATNGTVVKSPDLVAYNNGATVQLTATPNSGYTFTSWSGDTTGFTNPLPILMNANKIITANFAEADTKALQALIDQCPTNGTVSIPAGTYYIDAMIALRLKSDMTLKMDNGTILKAMPNNTASITNVIKIEGKSNVAVSGGTLQGERAGHIGTTGEFGMGIGLYGASNVTLNNITIKDCWGDGIYVGYNCKNIKLDSIIADNNRRQGMSIVYVDGMVVENSVFKNTKGTWPQAGIDLEPNSATEPVKNVQIRNSQFLHNYANGIVLSDRKHAVTNVIVDGNTITGNGNGGAVWVIGGVPNNYSFTNNTIVDRTAGFFLQEGSTGNTITGNTVTAPVLITGDDGGNTISGNILNLP